MTAGQDEEDEEDEGASDGEDEGADDELGTRTRVHVCLFVQTAIRFCIPQTQGRVCIKLPLQQTAIEVRKRAARVCRANRLRIAPHCLGDHSASLCVCVRE